MFFAVCKGGIEIEEKSLQATCLFQEVQRNTHEQITVLQEKLAFQRSNVHVPDVFCKCITVWIVNNHEGSKCH